MLSLHLCPRPAGLSVPCERCEESGVSSQSFSITTAATLSSAQSSPGPHTDIMLRYIAATVLLATLTLGARVRRDDGYGAPEPDTYGAPAEAYGAPDTSYSAPSYAADAGLDLTTIIIPLLALLGLFLLFPTYVTLTSVRRKREAIEDAGETNMVERMMDMYQVGLNFPLFQ